MNYLWENLILKFDTLNKYCKQNQFDFHYMPFLSMCPMSLCGLNELCVLSSYEPYVTMWLKKKELKLLFNITF